MVKASDLNLIAASAKLAWRDSKLRDKPASQGAFVTNPNTLCDLADTQIGMLEQTTGFIHTALPDPLPDALAKLLSKHPREIS